MMTAEASGPLRPNPDATLQFLAWWFHDCTRGVVEIGSIVPGTRSLSVFNRFELDDLESAAEYAARTNSQPGASVYFRASTIDPAAPPAGARDADTMQSPGLWTDHDSEASVAALTANPLPVKPPAWVVTGTTPHLRVQAFWRLSEPLTNPDMVRDLNKRLIAVFHCDTTTYNPSRLMRLPGTIAWPIKAGRSIAELTTWQRGKDRPSAISIHQIAFALPKIAEPEAPPPHPASAGEPAQPGAFNIAWPTTGVPVAQLLQDYRLPGMWHQSVLRLVAHWIGRGWSDAEILATAPHLTLPGYTADQTRRDLLTMIKGGREKWAAPDPQHVIEGAGTSPDTFHTYAISEIISMPPPEWLVGGILTVDGLAAFYGPPASLKSFVAISAGLSIAYGLPWMGRPTKQTGVLYVAAEGVRGLGRRIRAWQRQNGMEGVEAPFRLLAATVNLTDTAQTTKLIRTAIAAAETEGCKIGLVIIDTVARAMAGADENSAQDMGRFIAGCDAIREAIKCALLGVHHSGKDETKGARGSSAFLGAMDTLVRVKREEDKESLTLTVEKQKDDDEGDPIRLQAVKVEIGSGIVPETSLAIIPREPAQRGRPRGETVDDTELLARVVIAMNGVKEAPLARLAEAILGTRNGDAYRRIASLIPAGVENATVLQLGKSTARIWKRIAGEHRTAPIYVVVEQHEQEES